MSKMILLTTDTETLEFKLLKDVAEYLGINEGTKKNIDKKCKNLEYEIVYPVKKNDLPLK